MILSRRYPAGVSSPPRGIAYALTQLGTLGAQRFSACVGELGLTAPESGVIRLLAGQQGMSQRELATRLGAAPSRVVVLVDSLESKGLVRRERSATDRRNHELRLTADGEAMLGRLGRAAGQHEAELVAPLTEQERDRLAALLEKLRDAHGLDPLVHPGYRERP